ncbi:unnamed protein product [Lupinus luteus]|uniref:CALMODULIN-BINDING PROTEIN60 n=1 Tax=Lupinus luteus TaxID=3873 RepID=A0AAV1VYX4_LUPLU
MVPKVQSQQDHEGSSSKIPIRDSKWSHFDTKQAPIIGLRNVINVLCLNDHNSYLETFLRRLVREAVESKIQDYQIPRPRINNQASISGTKLFQLCFINKLPDKIFSLSNIIAEDKSPLQIALFDVITKSIVKNGPLSSMKIEICALNGDFGSEDWNEVEFNANILKEREGKGPLINGERFITLQNGVGCVTKITLTDNSRWVRSRKFRLGAKVVQSNSIGTNVKEARSDAFVVKDYRGESYKKHYPPSLKDDVWRLVKISKGGKIHARLALDGIHTVKDFLQLYTINQSLLLEKFGRISKKSWLAITAHAKTCVIDDSKLYIYQTEEPPIGLVFNSIYNLVEVTFDGLNYFSLDTLTPNDKIVVELVKQHAYNNVNNLKPVDETLLNCVRPVTCLRASRSHAQDQVLPQINISTAEDICKHTFLPIPLTTLKTFMLLIYNLYYADQQETLADSNQPFISASYIDEGVNDFQPYADPILDQIEMQENSYAEGEFFSNWNLHGSYSPLVEGGYSTENESSDIQLINDYPTDTTWVQENDFYYGSSDGAKFSSHCSFLNSSMDISISEKPKAVWHKILTVLKCLISMRRDAYARRNADLFYYNY